MKADFIITHARVITVDPAKPKAEAVALGGNRILFVGSNEEVEAWRDPGTRMFHAEGRTVLPGFIDSHYHLLMGSAEMGIAALEEAASLEELGSALRLYAQENPGVAWVCGAHLKYDILPGEQRLTRHHLDAIISDRPVALMAYDYHTLWANTLALEMAGILCGGKSEPNSEIVMGEDGQASGELRERGAFRNVLALTGAWGRANNDEIGKPSASGGPPDMTEERQLLRRGLALAARNGITSVHNMDGNFQLLSLYAGMEDLGELTARIYVPLSVRPETPMTGLQEAIEMRQNFHTEMVHSGFVKFFMDGVVETWTAVLLEDYADRDGERGSTNYGLEHFTEMAVQCDRLGLQVAVHAIGDGAVRQTLDGFEAVQKINGKRDSRHRIEHIEIIHPQDLPRFAQLGVIASMQLLHLPGALGEDKVWLSHAGQERWGHSFAWQSLRQAGARLVFGSDWPVVQPDPMLALHVALNRKPWLPGLPDQQQNLEQAIASYTYEAAFAEFREDCKGQLRPGMLADLVLLSEDLESVPAEEISRVHPAMTICDGRVVYEV